MSISLTPHGIHTPEEICKCKTEAQKGIQYIDKHCHCSPRLHKLSYRLRASRRGWQAKQALVSLAFVWLISCPAFLWVKKKKCVRSVGNSVKNKKFIAGRIDIWMLLLPNLPHSILKEVPWEKQWALRKVNHIQLPTVHWCCPYSPELDKIQTLSSPCMLNLKTRKRSPIWDYVCFMDRIANIYCNAILR